MFKDVGGGCACGCALEIGEKRGWRERERPGVLSTDVVENVAVGLCWRTEPYKTLFILTHAPQWLRGCCSERGVHQV